MKKILLLSLLLCAGVQQIWADYVTDIVVIGHDSERQVGYLYDNYKGAGWIGIDRDLNDGAGGHYIHLVYKTNKSPQNSGTPITDLYLWSATYAGPDSFVRDGRTYYRIGADGDDTFKSHGGDMNCEAGGNWIQLYYTKDRYKPHRYVTSLSIDSNSSGCIGENGGSTPGDLNRGAGGDDIFLHFSVDYEGWREHMSNSFSHVNGNTIYIESEGELAKLARDVDNGNDYFGKTIVLNRDLDLSMYNWNPIGYLSFVNDKPEGGFKGNFDGRGHTIRGLYVERDEHNSGLFGCIVGGYFWGGAYYQEGCEYIKNLNIVDAYVHGNLNVGGLAGYVYGEFTIENVMTQGNIYGNNYVGGVVGYAKRTYHFLDQDTDLPNTVSIKDCAFLGNTVSGSNANAIYGTLQSDMQTKKYKNYYANLSSPGNPNTYRLSAVNNKSLPEDINVNYECSGSYWYNGIAYCKGGSYVMYDVTSNSVAYDLLSTSVNGQQMGVKDHFNIEEGTDYTIEVYYEETGITGSGSEADPYILTTGKQWSQLCRMVSRGQQFDGLHFKLGADIEVTTPMPDFRGTFDGDGHTLTVSLTPSEPDYGPFCCATDATFKNLHVAGTITTDQTSCAGLVGSVFGTTSIINCRSSVTILSSTPGISSHGGFVGTIGYTNVNVSIDGCLFDGKILTVGDTSSDGCGGLVGDKRNNSTLSITNSLYAPAELADGEQEAKDNSYTLARYTDGAAPSIGNAGYTRPLGTAQGVSGTDTKPLGMGDAVETYNVSGITRYNNGLEHHGWWYLGTPVIDLADDAPNSSIISEAADIFTDKLVNATLRGRSIYHDGKWNTICLPFDVTLAGSLFEGYEARTLAGASINNDTLTLNFSDPVETLIAGTPYILKKDVETTDADLIIRTAKDWDAFVASMNDGNEYSGVNVLLTADITVSTPAAPKNHPFRGTFNGNGYTLTFNSTTQDQYWAPFRYAAGATFVNVHTAGTINVRHNYASGLVGHPSSTITFRNCRSSVDFVCTANPVAAGFIGYAGVTLNNTFTNCLFDGSFTNNSISDAIIRAFQYNWVFTEFDFNIYNNCLANPKSISGNNISYAPYFDYEKCEVNNSYYYPMFPYTGKSLGTSVGDMTNMELAAALGDGWEVKDGKVTPLVKKVNAGGIITNPTFYDLAVTAAEPTRITPGLTAGTEGDGSVTFCGTYDPVEIGEEGDNTMLYFSDNNTLYWPNGAMTINPFRAYLQLNGATAQTRSIVLNIGGETTAIEVGGVKEVRDDSWYDMSGRRLVGKPTAKGFYINNGKKVVIK